jgi:hypothetical protein
MRVELFIEDGSGVVLVTLSRRNLLALLAKLEQPSSWRTLVSGDVHRDGQMADDVKVVVRSEPDELHYHPDREPPGPMMPATEAAIRWAEARAVRDADELP